MIVSHVQLNRIAIGQYAGPPYERNIVIVDDVEPSLVEKTPHCTAIQDGQAGLLGEQHRKRAGAAAQANHFNAVRFSRRGRFRPSAQHVMGVHILQDCDLVPPARESLREALDSDPVPAEIVGRIEGRHHAKPQPAHPAVSRNVCMAIVALRSQLSLPVRKRATSPILLRALREALDSDLVPSPIMNEFVFSPKEVLVWPASGYFGGFELLPSRNVILPTINS